MKFDKVGLLRQRVQGPRSKLGQEVCSLQVMLKCIVFLTHNHFPGEKKQGRLQGILPVYKNGRPVQLSPEVIDDCGHPDEVIRLDPISDPWYSKGITAYLVMLKTLQQARMEGIWKPALSYVYKWGDTVYMTDRGSRTNMSHALDVGVFTLAEFQDRQLKRKRYILDGFMLI